MVKSIGVATYDVYSNMRIDCGNVKNSIDDYLVDKKYNVKKMFDSDDL